MTLREQAEALTTWFAQKYMEPKRAPTYSKAEMTDRIEAALVVAQQEMRERCAELVQSRCGDGPNCPTAAAIRALEPR
jgi:hypothetical protein